MSSTAFSYFLSESVVIEVAEKGQVECMRELEWRGSCRGSEVVQLVKAPEKSKSEKGGLKRCESVK